MDPHLRPAPPDGKSAAPCPPGHVAEPAGLWADRHMEVVYDPARHDVCIVRGRLGDTVSSGLQATGWQKARAAGGAQMWVRDRAEAARTQLAAAGTAAAQYRGLGR